MAYYNIFQHIKNICKKINNMPFRQVLRNKYFILFFSLIAVILFLAYSQMCHVKPNAEPLSLEEKRKKCKEIQFYGFSVSHFAVFAVIGFIFPEKFWLVQSFGILFELVEFILSYYAKNRVYCLRRKVLPESVVNMFGNQNNCMMTNMVWNMLDVIGGRHYYPSGESNYHSPIDYWIQEPSESHWWHAKITDVIMNLAGFAFGYICYLLYSSLNLK
jgi:hypothetical protein